MPAVRQVLRLLVRVAALALVMFLAAEPVLAQEKDKETDEVKARAKRQREGAGLRGGVWLVPDREVQGAQGSETPSFEGYFQRGLDLHLAIESSVGFWRRHQEIARSGGALDAVDGRSAGVYPENAEAEQVNSYIIPLFTALKLYPATRPEQPTEPYILGGVGFALGIDDRQNTAGGILGVGGGDGTVILTGFGFKAGAGVEFRLGRAFGLNVGGRYQWVRFGDEVGGERTFKGLGLDAGFTYRFQYE